MRRSVIERLQGKVSEIKDVLEEFKQLFRLALSDSWTLGRG